MSKRTLNNIAIIIFGVLFIGGSLFCFSIGSFGRTERSRWEAAPLVQEAGELRTMEEGNDVALTGFIAPDTPEVRGGLALFERWKYKRSSGQRTYYWERILSHKPAFELLLGEQRVVVHSAEAALVYAREVRESYRRKLVGFAPGDEVTVLGTVTLASGSPQVHAKYICGSNKEACLKHFSHIWGLTVAAVVLFFLLGGGLIGLGIVRLRAQRRRPDLP